jgi:hypothetical protein
VEVGEVLAVTPETGDALLDRFGSFHDAVVKLVEFDVERKTASVELDAQDGAAAWSWRRVRFGFGDIEEWRFERINTATEIIFEASIHSLNDLLFVSFEGNRNVPLAPTEADLQLVRSLLYIAARRCECQVARDLIA